MAGDWSDHEVELIVADYFAMLKKQLMGEKYVKAHHRNNLLPKLENRTAASIEFKHRNLSAAVLRFGIPYLDGYRPAENFQSKLIEKIDEFLKMHPGFADYLNHDLKRSPEFEIPSEEEILESLVAAPELKQTPKLVIREPQFVPRYQVDYLQREAGNQKLGKVGEEFVLRFEKARLRFLGKDNLSDKVEHVSVEQGDGAGFDILSFDEQSNDKYIEVKSTRSGIDTPFYFTRNELEFSNRNSNSYFLYRVFGIRQQPRFFVLPGSLEQTSNFKPTQFIGWPK
jgi:hypothetical protein